MSEKNELTYCIKCREKTVWVSLNNLQLKLTHNHKLGSRGTCYSLMP